MKWPSEKYTTVSDSPNRWLGPCGDSFCFSSCDSAHCHSEGRLGDTPKKHNLALKKMKKEELEAARKLISERLQDDSTG